MSGHKISVTLDLDDSSFQMKMAKAGKQVKSLSVDFTSLNNSLHAVEVSVARAASSIDHQTTVISDGFKRTSRAIGKATGAMIGEIRQLADMTDDMHTSMVQGFANVATSVSNMSQRLAAALSQVESAISQSKNAVQGHGREVKKATEDHHTLAATMRETIVLFYSLGTAAHLARAMFVDWQKHIIESNAHIEQLQVMMEGMSSAITQTERAAMAAKDVRYLFELGKTAPFDIKSLADSFVKFRSVGLDPTAGSLKALIDGVARFGGSGEMLHRASIAIQQMAGKGVISMEELRQQLGEAVPEAITAMATSLSMTYSDLANKISQGTVRSLPALTAMFSEFERRWGGSAERMMETWSGLSQKMSIVWAELMKTIGDAGYFDAMKTALQDILHFMEGAEAKRWAKEVGEALTVGVDKARWLVSAIADNRDAIGALIVAAGKLLGAFLALRLASAVLLGLAASAGAVGAALKATYGVLTAGGAVLLSLGAAGSSAVRAISTLPFTLSLAGGSLLGLGAAVMRLIPHLAVIGTLVWGAKMAYDAFTDSSDKVKDRLRENGAEASRAAQDIKLLTADMDRLNAEHERLLRIKKAQEEYQRRIQGGRATKITPGVYVDTDSELAKNEANQRETAQMLRDNEVIRDEEEARAAVMKMERDLNREMTAARAEYTRETKNLEVQLQKNNITQEEHVKRRAAAERHMYDVMINKLQEYTKSASDLLTADNASWTQLTVNSAKMNALQERMLEIQQKRKEISTDLIDIDAGPVKQLEQLKKELESRLAKYTDMTESPGSSGYRAQMEKRFEEIAAGIAKINDETEKSRQLADLQILRNLSAQVHSKEALAMAQTGLNQIDRNIASAQAELDNMNGKVAALQVKWNTGDWGDIKVLSEKNPEIVQQVNDKLAQLKSLMQQVNDTKVVISIQEDIDREIADFKHLTARLNAMGREGVDLATHQGMAVISNLEADYEEKFARLREKRSEADEAGLAMLNDEEVLLRNQYDIARGLAQEAAKRTEALARAREGRKADRAEQKELNAIDRATDQVRRQIAAAKADVDGMDRKVFVHLQKLINGELGKFAQFKGSPVESVSDLYAILNDDKALNNTFVMTQQLRGFIEELRKLENIDVEKDIGKRKEKAADLIEDLKVAAMEANEELAEGPAALQAAYEREKVVWQDKIKEIKDGTDERKSVEGEYYRWVLEREKQLRRELRTPMQQLVDDWADSTDEMGQAYADWADGALDALTNFVKTGKLEWRSFVVDILVGLAKIQLQKAASGWIDLALSAAGGMFGATAMGDGATSANSIITGKVGMASEPLKMANGGIMTEFGAIPLRKYASGGVARTPQMAIFSEGSMAEAFVPLPDGRSIPVSMKGGGAQNIAINITVNEGGGTSVNTSGNDSGQWMKMAERVKGVVQEEIGRQKRPGGMLYK